MSTDYERVEAAIRYIRNNVEHQPDLKSVAAHVGLSPYHFQRLFQRWAGVSPKRFLEYLTLEQAKNMLRQSSTVLDASLESGLSGPGRLHDHFVSIEAVTPGEFKKGGEGLLITYAWHDSPFGEAFMAITHRGILALAFCDSSEEESHLVELKKGWPNASFTMDKAAISKIMHGLFDDEGRQKENILLHIRGTNFQVRVWQALLNIPVGSVTSYQAIAECIDKPRSVRAVANAIAANPVAWLIPCHRVLRSNGELSGYRWGPNRKQLMLAREWAEKRPAAIQ